MLRCLRGFFVFRFFIFLFFFLSSKSRAYLAVREPLLIGSNLRRENCSKTCVRWCWSGREIRSDADGEVIFSKQRQRRLKGLAAKTRSEQAENFRSKIEFINQIVGWKTASKFFWSDNFMLFSLRFFHLFLLLYPPRFSRSTWLSLEYIFFCQSEFSQSTSSSFYH